MADGSDLELQAAINAKLAADAAVTALLGSPLPLRLYQDVPTPVTLPYATFGNTTATDDSTECQDAMDLYLDIEVWSRSHGFEEIKRIASAIRSALNNVDLTLATQRCVFIQHVTTRHLRESELPMKQAILTFHANLEGSVEAGGGGSDNFDRTPDAFNFTDATGVELSTATTSTAITVGGIDAPTTIAVSGGAYSINGGTYTSFPGTVNDGDVVTARGTSSGSYSTAVNVVVTIGGVSDTYSITTKINPAIGTAGEMFGFPFPLTKAA